MEEMMEILRSVVHRLKKYIIFAFIFILIGVGLIGWIRKPQGRETKTIENVAPSSKEASKQKITFEYISKKLENISELVTAEMIYNNNYTVEDGKIPFITKKGFTMAYTAYIKAGIDTSLLSIDVTDDEVKIVIPQSIIQTIRVDPDSIQFYDEKHAIFNKDKKTDITQAISAAEDDAEEKADIDGLLERASEEAEYVIKGILEDSVGDKKLTVLQVDEM